MGWNSETWQFNFLVYVYLLLHNWDFWGMTGFITSYGSCSFVALDGGNHLVVQFLGIFLSSSS